MIFLPPSAGKGSLNFLSLAIRIFVWISCGWLASSLIQTFVWPSMEKRVGYPPPKLLQNIVTAVIILTIALSIFGFVLKFPHFRSDCRSSVLAAVIAWPSPA